MRHRAERSNESHDELALELLARKSKVPPSEVARLYEHARAELGAGARIKSFLGIFALRRVRTILHQRATSSGVSPLR